MKELLLDNIASIHTTKLGIERIKHNLNITGDVVVYIKELINNNNCLVSKNGKNYYCEIDNVIITINSNNYCIITAHKKKI